MDIKIIANVGYWAGLNGKGALYAAITTGGTYLIAFKNLVSGVEEWTYLRRSQVENGLAMGDMKVADNLNLALFTDVESPEFATGSSTLKKITTVTNGDDLPRLIQLESPYTLKGEGVVTSDIDKLKGTAGGGTVTNPPANGTTPTTGALGGLIPTDFSTLFSNPVKFIQDNPMFLLIVVAAIYFFRRKKKKPLRLF